MDKRIAFGSLLFLLLSLVGCASTDGYRQFYTPLPGATPEKLAETRAAPPPSMPQVAHLSGSFDENIQREFSKRGYEVMGYSRFTSGYRQNDDDAINEGKKVAADFVVILNSQYAGSVTSTVPFTTPTTSTSVTNGMATAYGTGGSAVAFGNATTTTYGTSTTYVPMTVSRFQYEAVYLVKMHYHLGVKDRELSDRERLELQSNRGVCVTTVIDGTPAYSNDILPGDIITAIDGYGTDFESFNAMLSVRTGKTTELTIFRQGHLISKSVSLAP